MVHTDEAGLSREILDKGEFCPKLLFQGRALVLSCLHEKPSSWLEVARSQAKNLSDVVESPLCREERPIRFGKNLRREEGLASSVYVGRIGEDQVEALSWGESIEEGGLKEENVRNAVVDGVLPGHTEALPGDVGRKEQASAGVVLSQRDDDRPGSGANIQDPRRGLRGKGGEVIESLLDEELRFGSGDENIPGDGELEGEEFPAARQVGQRKSLSTASLDKGEELCRSLFGQRGFGVGEEVGPGEGGRLFQKDQGLKFRSLGDIPEEFSAPAQHLP